jgi:hypothetical protein
MVEIRQDGDSLLLPVKVVPGASRTRCLGELGGRLKVAVSSPPEAGRANRALIAHLADRLGVRKRAIAIESGRASPEKIIRITGVTGSRLRAALGLDPP